MAFNLFPFTNLHNLNTDWILKTIKELKTAAETAASQVQEALANAVLYTSQSKDTSSRRVACTNIHAVSYDSTVLSDADKAQARTNIGAASPSDIPTGLVSYAEVQSLTPGQTAQARANIAAAAASALTAAEYRITGLEGSRVSYAAAQSLTDSQKAQARSNIGAIGSGDIPAPQDAVLYTEQSLSSTQQAQARTNIGAVSASDIPAATTVLNIYVQPNELETGYECVMTAAQIEAAADSGRPISMFLTPIGSNTSYPILPIFNYNSETLISITADLFIPIDASSLASCTIYHLTITSDSPDTITVTDGTGKLITAPSGILDAGKVLTVNNLGAPSWQTPGPTVITDTSSTTPTIASAADNTIYKFTQDITSLSVTAGSGSYMICFHSGSTATTTSFPVSILGLDDFVPETNTYYEINVMDGRAVWMGWADPAL